MPYVSRNAGVINGLYANAQPGYAEEFLADSNAEVLAYLAAIADGGSAQTARSRADAEEIIENSKAGLGKLLRAFAAVLADEINILREWTRDLKTQTAAATSLADFKTRVATLPTLNDRTLAQAKIAIVDKVNGGSVD